LSLTRPLPPGSGKHIFNRLPLAEAQPVVPGLPQIVFDRNVLLLQVVLFRNLIQDAAHGKIFGFQNRISPADRSVVMSVAGGGHGETSSHGIVKR
jgi:hypothetical protein